MVNMNRILLAEDNDDLRELITDFLSEHGFDVYAAVDGEDAWEAVQTTRYQLVLLDVMMPGMDGFTLCRKIRGTGIGAGAFPDSACAGRRSAAWIRTWGRRLHIETIFSGGASCQMSGCIGTLSVRNAGGTAKRSVEKRKTAAVFLRWTAGRTAVAGFPPFILFL